MTTPTLAQRLGYDADARLLIVNCDDLGSSHSANLAIFRSMTSGVATSATLMVPCGWAREGARMLEKRAIGVHLTLTSEYEGYRWRGLTDGPTLHDEEGYLPKSTWTALERLSAADAKAECRAQIERALSWGVDITHLDAHMGVMQMRSDLFDVYLDMAVEYALPVRLYDAEREKRLNIDASARAAARGVLHNEHMVYPWPRVTRDVFFNELPPLPAGVTEIFVHPVLDGEELRAYDTDNADIRVHDYACLMDPVLRTMLEEQNFTRISFQGLRDLQRSGR